MYTVSVIGKSCNVDSLSLTLITRNPSEVSRRALGQTETLVSKINKRRLTWFGYVVRMEGKRLPAKALYCYMDG